MTAGTDTRSPATDNSVGGAPPQRRVWPYLAVIAVLVLAVILLLLRPGGSSGHTTPAAPTAGPAASASTPARPAAPEISWTSVYGVQLPVSATHGPFRTEGDLVSGFTHDAEGAALAAAHYGTRISPQVGPKVYTPVIARYGLGGSPAVLDALHAQYEQARASHAGVADGEPLPSTQNARVLGYRIPSYATTGPVTMHLLLSGDGPAGSVLVDLPVTVEWVDGTWKVQVPPDGNFPGTQARTTAGFTLF